MGSVAKRKERVIGAPLHQLESPQIMQTDDAEHAPRFICNHDGGDLAFLHQVQRFTGEHMLEPDGRLAGLFVMH